METNQQESWMMKAERRVADRKSIDSIHVSDLTSLENYQVIVHAALISDASIRGFKLTIERRDLVPENLKSNINLDELIGQQVVMFLPQMNLDLDGTITRATHTGRGQWEVAIDFSEDVPEYWRECLIDLLPAPGELSESE